MLESKSLSSSRTVVCTSNNLETTFIGAFVLFNWSIGLLFYWKLQFKCKPYEFELTGELFNVSGTQFENLKSVTDEFSKKFSS